MVILSAVTTSYSADAIVVLENAESTKLDVIGHYAKAIVDGVLSGLILVVITNEYNPDTKEARFRPFVEKGRYVECTELSVDSMKKYVQEEIDIEEDALNLLLELCSYNFRKLVNEVIKIKLTGLVASKEAVEKYIAFSADDLLLRYLLLNNIDKAKMVVSAVDKQQTPKILYQLVRKLLFLSLVIRNDVDRMSAHALASVLEVQPWQLLEFFSIKKYWNIKSIENKVKIILSVDRLYCKTNSNVLNLLLGWW